MPTVDSLAKKDGRREYHTIDGWQDIQLQVMLNCLLLKVYQHPEVRRMLAETYGPIVEKSSKDQFWGALQVGESLVGINCLGKLWVRVRKYLETEWIRK